MPNSGSNLNDIVNYIAESMRNVGYQNDKFTEFVKFLLNGRQILGSYTTGTTAPDELPVYLDIMVLTRASIVSITALRTGAVQWGVASLKEFVSAAVDAQGGVALAVFSLATAGALRLADTLDQEGDLNRFVLQVSEAAWGT